MYSIRVTPESRLLVTAWGRLTAEEAMRMVSQGLALAEAGAITEVLADVREVERAPGQWMVIAALLGHGAREPMKLAVVAQPRQASVVQRIVRYAGLRRRATVVFDEATAMAWLSRRPERAPTAAEARHAALSAGAAEEFRPKAG